MAIERPNKDTLESATGMKAILESKIATLIKDFERDHRGALACIGLDIRRGVLQHGEAAEPLYGVGIEVRLL